MNLLDSQQYTFSVEAEDKAGNATSDAVTVTVDDPTILALTGPDANGEYTAAATGKLGTAVLTAADNTTSPPFLGTEAVAVVAGATSQIVFNANPPTDIVPPAPAGAVAPAGDGTSVPSGDTGTPGGIDPATGQAIPATS
jgi:hypothetical protein